MRYETVYLNFTFRKQVIKYNYLPICFWDLKYSAKLTTIFGNEADTNKKGELIHLFYSQFTFSSSNARSITSIISET